MTSEQFINWLAAMREAGIAKSDAECARLLGMSKTSIVNLKHKGGQRWMALACSALLNRLEPYA